VHLRPYRVRDVRFPSLLFNIKTDIMEKSKLTPKQQVEFRVLLLRIVEAIPIGGEFLLEQTAMFEDWLGDQIIIAELRAGMSLGKISDQ
jgi:hypothetical protein